MNKKRFRYLGLMFEDLQTNVSADQAIRHISSDKELGMSQYEWGIYPYTYEGFYKAAKQSTSDLFRCVLTGKIYIPGENELFLYQQEE